MVKKSSIAIGLLFASTALYAAHPDTVIGPLGENATAPASQSSWSFGIEGLYMVSSNSDFQYAQISDQGNPKRTYTNKSVKPEYDFGGEFDATYHFAGNSRDAMVALTHIDLNSSSSYDLQSGRMSDPFGLSNAFTDQATAKMDNSVDAVDIVLGQSFNLGERVSLRVFGGLRYADLENNNSARYFDNDSDTPSQGNATVNTGFDGIGPRAGMDAAVHVGSGISFVSTVGVSLLKGSIETKTTVTPVNRAPGNNTPTVYDNSGKHSVVPEMDAKLGINYHHPVSQDDSFDIQIGYQAVNYFDVVDTDFIDANTPNAMNNDSDLGYYGPYLRFQFNLV